MMRKSGTVGNGMDTCETEFQDTRFYISIRPSVEYLLPQMYSMLIDALFGQLSRESVIDEMNKEQARLVASSSNSLSQEGECVEHIESQCSDICDTLNDYLSSLDAAWFEYTSRIFRGVNLEKMAIKDGVHSIVKEAQKAPLSHRANHRHLEDLRKQLRRVDRVIAAHRAMQTPCVNRPEHLDTGANALRSMFLDSYGKYPTKALANTKKKMASQMIDLELTIFRRFNEKALKLIDQL